MPVKRIFPQLATGAITQYPLRIQERFRTLVNQLGDGRRIRYSDVGASALEWEVSHQGLSDDEWLTMEGLFRECEGRRYPFLFLDPWSNLIADSETFVSASWTKEPGIGLAEGLTDPEGGPRATQATNTAATLQSVAQTVAIPAWFQYSFSVYARSNQAGQMRLIASTDGAFAERLFELSSDWQRYPLFSAMTAYTEMVQVAIQIPAGAAIEIFGAQLEAQPSPSPYQRNGLRTGRYPEARFAGDTLAQTSTGPGEHSTSIRIRSQVVAYS